jgi:hypothetical protein
MALKICSAADIATAFTQDGSLTSAFRQSFDGRTGEIQETNLFVGNNDAGKSYSSITLSPVVKTGKEVTDGTNGYGVKLYAGVEQPTTDEWAAISYSNSISLGSVPDTATFLPFWVLVDVPKGAPAESLTGVVFRLTADET